MSFAIDCHSIRSSGKLPFAHAEAAPSSQKFAIAIELLNTLVVSNIDIPPAIYCNAEGLRIALATSLHTPCHQELALVVEFLNAVIILIGHINIASLIDSQSLRPGKKLAFA